MSTLIEEEIESCTAKRKTALMLETIKGKTNVAEANRTYGLLP